MFDLAKEYEDQLVKEAAESAYRAKNKLKKLEPQFFRDKYSITKKLSADGNFSFANLRKEISAVAAAEYTGWAELIVPS